MLYDQMKQKRKVKSLLPKKFCLDGRMLTILLLVLSLVLCMWSVSLLTHSVKAAGTSAMDIQSITYTWIDNKVEVLYNMQFADPSNLEKVVNNLYMSGESLYISPNIVVVSGDNIVWTGKYSHILWWMGNEIYSNNITIIAWKNNIVRIKNNNASILWWVGNEIGTWYASSERIPSVFVWWSGNKAIYADKGAVLIWWRDNRVENYSSFKNTFLLWWYQNYSRGTNIILWWHDITNTSHNVFVYSNYPGSGWIIFEPSSSNAFYLHVISGAGINTEWIEWLSVGWAVSIGGVWHYTCMNYALGEMMNYSGCLVWCTDVGATEGKWEMLDKWDRCADICRNHNAWCFMSSDEIDVNDYAAQCTKWVNTENAHLCVSWELSKYKNVLFETSLIDSDEKCDLTQDICTYQCNQWTHLMWDGANRRCYSDCSYTRNDWTEVRNIKHGEFITWYNVGEVKCGSDGAGDVCSNHVKSLFCNSGSMRIGSMNGEPVELRQYYKQCVMSWYVCSDEYNLTYNDIITNYQEEGFATGNLKWWQTVTWTRWVYEVCINFWGVGTDSCSTWAQDFKFLNCRPWYVQDGSWVCRQGCGEWYNNGSKKTFYKSGSVTCTGTCVGSEFTCYDGSWTWTENKSNYPYTWCNLKDKVCNTGVYNVTYSEYLTWKDTWMYECCTGYVHSWNTQCDLGDVVCKLVGCKDWYHTGANGKFCVSDTMNCDSPEPDWYPSNLGDWIKVWPGIYEYNTIDNTSWHHINDNSSGTPWVCEWRCDIENGWVWDGNLWCEKEESVCIGTPPSWTGVILWSGSPSQSTGWKYVEETNLWPCEWRCDTDNKFEVNEDKTLCECMWWYHLIGNRCVRYSLTCSSSEAYKCLDESGGTVAGSDTWYSNGEYTWMCGDTYCSLSDNTTTYKVCRRISYSNPGDCWRWESSGNPQQIITKVSFKKFGGWEVKIMQPITLRWLSQQKSYPPFGYSNTSCLQVCDWHANNEVECGSYECYGDIFGGDGPKGEWITAVCAQVLTAGNYWRQYIQSVDGNATFSGDNASQFEFVPECPEEPKCWNTENTCNDSTSTNYDPIAKTWKCSNVIGESVQCSMQCAKTCPMGYTQVDSDTCRYSHRDYTVHQLTNDDIILCGISNGWYDPIGDRNHRLVKWDDYSCNEFWPLFIGEGDPWWKGVYYLETKPGPGGDCDYVAGQNLRPCIENLSLVIWTDFAPENVVCNYEVEPCITWCGVQQS